MQTQKEELIGTAIVYELFAAIWLKDFQKMNHYIESYPFFLEEFPFLKNVDIKEAKIYYENYFEIPGVHFVSPYHSSYYIEEKKEVMVSHLQKLIKILELWKVESPMEYNVYPDHIGVIYQLLSKFQLAAIEAEAETLAEIKKMEDYVRQNYAKPILKHISKHSNRMKSMFFQSFILAQDDWL